jgi:hypothetical protein
VVLNCRNSREKHRRREVSERRRSAALRAWCSRLGLGLRAPWALLDLRQPDVGEEEPGQLCHCCRRWTTTAILALLANDERGEGLDRAASLWGSSEWKDRPSDSPEATNL